MTERALLTRVPHVVAEYFEVCFGGGLSCLGVGSVGSEAWPVAFKRLVFRKGLRDLVLEGFVCQCD